MPLLGVEYVVAWALVPLSYARPGTECMVQPGFVNGGPKRGNEVTGGGGGGVREAGAQGEAKRASEATERGGGGVGGCTPPTVGRFFSRMKTL